MNWSNITLIRLINRLHGPKNRLSDGNLYDPETQVIVVFKKQGNEDSNQFTTTCEVTPVEETHLFKSAGSFMTEANLQQQNEFNSK